MFEEGKTYRVKTLEQLLATPGAMLSPGGDVVKFSTTITVYALCNEMVDFLGKDITPERTMFGATKAKYGSYTFTPEMILWETKKLKLLNAIKDFK